MSRRSKILDTAKQAYAVKALEINAQNTMRTNYYRGYLWRLFLGAVDVTVPEHWSIDYVRRALFLGGGVAVTELDSVVVPMSYTVNTYNKWHYPVKILSSDTVQAGERTVGIDAEIIYLTDANKAESGVESMIDLYAQKLANTDGAIDTNMLLSRTAILAEVANEREAAEARLMFTKIMSGEPAVFHGRFASSDIDKRDSPFSFMKVRDNFIADSAQIAKRMIINEYLTAIGVNNANMDKRERLISSEVAANDIEIETAVSLWQDNVDRCVKRVKAMFGDTLLGDLSIRFKGVHNSATTGFDGDIPDQAR